MYDKHVRRRRAALALLVVVSLILLTAYFGESAGSPLHSVQRGVVQVLSPVQEGASRALKPVRDLFGWFGDTARAKKERDQLKAQRDRLLEQVVGYQVALEENQELRGILELGESNGLDAYEKRTVRIIGRSPNNLLRDTLQVDAGSGDGVREGDAVIAGGGLVGHVSTAAVGLRDRHAHHRPQLDGVREGAQRRSQGRVRPAQAVRRRSARPARAAAPAARPHPGRRRRRDRRHRARAGWTRSTPRTSRSAASRAPTRRSCSPTSRSTSRRSPTCATSTSSRS